MKINDAKASIRIDGVDYFFSSESNQQTFQANRDKYSTLASNDFRFLMNQALAQYFVIQESLANDSTNGVLDAANALTQVLEYAGQLTPALDETGLKTYKAGIASSRDASTKMSLLKKPAIDDVRAIFVALSDSLISYADAFNADSAEGTPLFVIRCSMAFDNKGASWMQRSDTTANPYFGSSMLECGKTVSRQLRKCMVMPEEDVDPTIAVAYQGKTYYFCCEKCVKKFNADPKQYLTR